MNNEEQKIFVNEDGKAVSGKKGTKFSAGRIATYCKNGRYSERIGAGSPIFMSGVMEYLVFEVLKKFPLVIASLFVTRNKICCNDFD